MSPSVILSGAKGPEKIRFFAALRMTEKMIRMTENMKE